MNDLEIPYVNIICDHNMNPIKLIITDGNLNITFPVANTRLSTCKRAAMQIFGIRPGNIIVSQLLNDEKKGRE